MLKGSYIKSETVGIRFQYGFDSSKTFSFSFERVLGPSNVNSDSMEKKKKNKPTANTLPYRIFLVLICWVFLSYKDDQGQWR